MLTIVMYHYVRDLPRTKFPRIKGLLTERFDGQLDYISRHYSVCSFAQVLAAQKGESDLPSNACVLTFDDGLSDHYETVLPRLLDRGMTAAFFPAARPVKDHCLLDVHKIQFILAATTDYEALTQELLELINQYREQFSIAHEAELLKELSSTNRFDIPQVVFFKKMLQWHLPDLVRSKITNELFAKY